MLHAQMTHNIRIIVTFLVNIPAADMISCTTSELNSQTPSLQRPGQNHNIIALASKITKHYSPGI